jgi:heme/copper-type cytochrome/quinol oxidase subunit 2
MYRLIPIGSLIFNFVYFFIFTKVLRNFIPLDKIPILKNMNDAVLSVILFSFIFIFLYTENGQRVVAFFAHGRNTIGREERILEPILNDLMSKYDIGGYSNPILFRYKIIGFLRDITLGKIKFLETAYTRILRNYKTGTVKIFTYDSLDIESNSFGNCIFISKGALDGKAITQDELKALIYNEFAQIQYNISNKRLLHQGNILLARFSCLFSVLLYPLASFFGVYTRSPKDFVMNNFILLGLIIVCLVRLIIFYFLYRHNIAFTNLFYMLYEREIFVDADRATDNAGLSKPMLSYLEKLYHFKLIPKDLGKLFAELRPLVAYRINYFDNVLGRNKNLDINNTKWSSNYIKYTQTLTNRKD